jgi:cob(I)alamin adenosyltransferase
MKIYTKTGDKGETSLIGGKRVSKDHPRIDAYGTIDELISFVGLLRDQIPDRRLQDTLLFIQDRLMICAAILAADCDDCKVKIPELSQDNILFLEKEIDKIESNLSPIHSFILPGGHQTVSLCHVTRTVCRRAERLVIKLSKKYIVPEVVNEYLNRLSDYFFVLSRKLSIDFKVVEHQWPTKL